MTIKEQSEKLNLIETKMNEIATYIKSVDPSNPDARQKLDLLETEYNSLNDQRSQIKRIQSISPVEVTISQINLKGASGSEERLSDPYSTPEYRNAFMDYVRTGKRSNVLIGGEGRVDASSTMSEVVAVIPTSIKNQIIDALSNAGEIFKRITKTAFPVGTRIPISAANPTASWVAENGKIDRQKIEVKTYVEFSAYKLQTRVSVSLEASVSTLEMFEKFLAQKIAQAIIVAIETAVVSGTGVGQPTGITIDSRIVAGQKIATKAGHMNYVGHIERLGKVPAGYESSNLAYLMHKETYFKYFLGLVDDNKQPVARINQGVDGKPSYTFLGYEVIFNNSLKSFDAALNNDLVVILGDFSQFDFNSSLQLTFRTYIDEDTDEVIHKATLLGDGKVLDPKPFVIYKKDTAA